MGDACASRNRGIAIMTQVAISSGGLISLTTDTGDVVVVDYTLDDHLGTGTVLDVALRHNVGETAVTPNTMILTLVWRDGLTNDELYKVEGVIGGTLDNPTSLLSRADAQEVFTSFDVTMTSDTGAFATAIADSDAYNEPSSLNRNKVTVSLPSEPEPAFSDTAIFNGLTLMRPKASMIGLARTDDLPLFVAVLRSAQKLNIPLDCEVDPIFNADQAIDYVEGLDIRDHRVATYWNPTLSRPRDAVSIRGALKPRPILGWLMGTRLLRNSRTNAQGIPPIQDPVAGYRYPIPFKRIKMRDDVQLDEFTIKRLAKAKINVVQPQDGSQGTRFVVGDVLTQYQSVNSVLRLTSSAEIECYTANTIIQIIHEHMLMGMTDFLTKANRACIEFLDKCSSQQAQLLVPAEDLGGAPYSLQLSPDSEKPFERVRVVFARRPNGVARSVVLDTTVNK